MRLVYQKRANLSTFKKALFHLAVEKLGYWAGKTKKRTLLQAESPWFREDAKDYSLPGVIILLAGADFCSASADFCSANAEFCSANAEFCSASALRGLFFVETAVGKRYTHLPLGGRSERKMGLLAKRGGFIPLWGKR